MRTLVEKVLHRYGTPVLLRRFTGDTVLYGIMQHTASLGWQNMQPVYSPLGEIPRGQYLLMVPVEPLLEKGDILRREEKWYTVRRVERVWHRDQPIYCWCLCEERGKVDNWGL
jgi:hypothetical protein